MSDVLQMPLSDAGARPDHAFPTLTPEQIARLRVAEGGEVIQLEREELLALIQTDGELSEIVVRALILRRVALIARELSDVVVVGTRHNAGTLRVKEFLTRNGHPFSLSRPRSRPRRAGSARSLRRRRDGHAGRDLPRSYHGRGPLG
jgi:hypothetical protein